MPVCYQLFPKGRTSPAALADVDKAICGKFGLVLDPDRWAENWHNIIGLRLAMGQSLEEVAAALTKQLEEDKAMIRQHRIEGEDVYPSLIEIGKLELLIEITRFLRDEYDVISWRE